jgi:hypothetical protein
MMRGYDHHANGAIGSLVRESNHFASSILPRINNADARREGYTGMGFGADEAGENRRDAKSAEGEG